MKRLTLPVLFAAASLSTACQDDAVNVADVNARNALDRAEASSAKAQSAQNSVDELEGKVTELEGRIEELEAAQE